MVGYKTAASASNSFANIKKKLNLTTNGAADGKAGPATPKGEGKAEANDEAGGDASGAINPKKRGRKAEVQIDVDGMEVAGSAPAPKKRATKGQVIGLGSETVVVSKPKQRGRKAKDDSTSTPNPVENEGANFWSENETASDGDTTSIEDFRAHRSSMVKQEDVDDDYRTFTTPINSNDVEATRTSQALSSADEELKSDHPQLYEDIVNMYPSI